MIKRICLLANYNLYESKRYFTEKLALALNEEGITTQIIDVMEGGLGVSGVKKIQAFQPDLTLSYHSFLPSPNEPSLSSLLKIPHLSILLDPSIYSVSLKKDPYTLVSCVDRKDVEAMRSYGFKQTFFLPHATHVALDYREGDDRPYDVVFLGSCYDYENIQKGFRQSLASGVVEGLEYAISIVLQDNQITTAEALVKAWNDLGKSLEGVDFTMLFYYLDYYTRGYDRIALIRSIKNANVHVFGELAADSVFESLGFDAYLGEQKNVTLHPSVPFSESFSILKKSKICLNSMPFFRDGTHERIFSGLASGAVPLTSESLYLRESFQDGKDLLYYHSSNYDLVNDQVESLLRDEVKRAQIASSGRDKVLMHHTWGACAKELLMQLNGT